MTEPLSEQLAEIRAEFGRTAFAPECFPRADVGALLAEIDRLQAERHTTNEALDDAVKAIHAKDQRIAELEKAAAVEYGIRVPDTTWPEDGVLLDGNTFDRQEQVDRLARYRDCWPNAELVSRTVHYGDWETDTEAGESQ